MFATVAGAYMSARDARAGCYDPGLLDRLDESFPLHWWGGGEEPLDDPHSEAELMLDLAEHLLTIWGGEPAWLSPPPILVGPVGVTDGHPPWSE